MIPKTGWKPMTSAPRDGTIIIVKFRSFNAKDGKQTVQPAQWLCDCDGVNWGWKKPWSMGTTAYADEWMTLAEFQERSQIEIATKEFDL